MLPNDVSRIVDESEEMETEHCTMGESISHQNNCDRQSGRPKRKCGNNVSNESERMKSVLRIPPTNMSSRYRRLIARSAHKD